MKEASEMKYGEQVEGKCGCVCVLCVARQEVSSVCVSIVHESYMCVKLTQSVLVTLQDRLGTTSSE